MDEEELEFQRVQQQAELKKQQLRQYIEQQLVNYINEAEHQDGFGYWEQFNTAEDAFRDVLLAWAVEFEVREPGDRPGGEE